MIKINLLPVPKARKVKKQAEMRSQFILAGLIIVIVGLLCGTTWMSLNKQTKVLVAKKAEANVELERLKELVKEVEGYEQNKKNLEEKNRIIEQLKKNQSGPVHLLDELSNGLEKLKLWLTQLEVKGKAIDMTGKALTNSDIVEFISNLKASKYFSDVQLVESKQIQEQGISIYSFRLKSNLVL
jgi:type IV pilus assembly protein PilN